MDSIGSVIGMLVLLAFDVIASVGADTAWASSRKRSVTDDPMPFRVVDWLALGIIGAGIGFVFGIAVPDRILAAAPIPGISLVVAPLLVGTCMHYIGRWLRANGYATDFVSTFRGAAWLAFWIAAARFVVLQSGVGVY